MKYVITLACLLLSGCFSADLTHSEDFVSVVGKRLTIQRPSIITPSKEMKSVTFGGWVDMFSLQERPKNFEQGIAEHWLAYEGSIEVPVGTELRITKVERRNLIDAGVEVLIFGEIWNPQNKKMEPFSYVLDGGLGKPGVKRAPWEDATVPEFREGIYTGARGFRYGPAVNESGR